MEEKKKKMQTLIKIVPVRRKIFHNDNSFSFYDSLVIFYRDEEGKKQKKFIPRAEIPYYLIKDKESFEATNPPMFIEKEKVEKFNTFSDNLYREIAAKTGCMNFFNEILLNYGEMSYNMKNILKHPFIYDADMDISDRYIQMFHEEFDPSTTYQIKKSYFDIEVDLMPNGFVKDKNGNIGYQGFPDEEIAPCPVSLISFFMEEEKKFYCFITKNEKNNSQKDFLENQEETKEFIKNWIKENDNEEVDIEFIVCEDEGTTIESFFSLVHKKDPDFCIAWNAGYDSLTLQGRLAKIRTSDKAYVHEWNMKMNPSYRNGEGKAISGKDIAYYQICDSESRYFKNTNEEDIYLQFTPYYKQQKEKLIVDRTESYCILDGINWFDQMGLFASIRKSNGQRESFSLDAIATEELDKEKLPFKPGQTIKNIPWKDFAQFVHYNIVDVLRCFQLEKKNLDLDLLQRLSEITNTRKEKVFKKTISLKNFVSKFAKENNFVMNNNKNSRYGNEEINERFKNEYLITNQVVETDKRYLESFAKKENFGAFVGDPLMNAPEGIEIFGKKSSFIFENVGDQDFASLYPSINRALNLDPTTQVGKFFWIDENIKANLLKKYDYDGLFSVSKNEDAEADSAGIGTNDIGPTLVDSLQSQNWERIGEKFFNLPSTEDIIEELKKKD